MKNDLFEKYPIPKAVLTLAIPTMLSMLVTIIYNMADTFFVGQTGDANQVAAVSLTMPIFFLLMAFGNIFGIGGGSYISRLLGERKISDIKHTSAFSFYGSITLGLIGMAAFLLFMDPVLRIAGASDNTIGFAKGYLTIIAYGAVAICLQNSLAQIVRSVGAAKESMIGMMIGTVINIILDPIMILSLNMGVVGAAWATIIGNACAVIYFIYYIFKHSDVLSIAPGDFRMEGAIAKNTFAIGLPASINNILMSFSMMILNNFASSYGDIVIAAFGVSSRVFSIVVMLALGLAMGIQPFIGYNYAQQNYKRMNDAIKFAAVIGMIMGAVVMVVTMIFNTEIVSFFINDPAVVEIGAYILVIQMLVSPFLGLQFIVTTVYQSLGKAIPSLILTVSRQGLAFIPILIIGSALFQLQGVIWAQPLADVFSIILAVSMYIVTYRKLQASKKEPVTLAMEDGLV
ncbi:MATE family efflux transporter [Acetobacterium carbinolicum]|jgi:putative MATE family efflux protein|uniref:MATE family efflux transporter n=1 Tax=Acetobacterium TaxID=33951 RepID=UPI000DBEC77C|nr:MULTISPECIES: MATE family efflux transporter [unclassified Acetobacterium]AWW25600.1 MATE family efflux transporter [Acetobacterium sp. KB-1]MDZ5724546.1 MATE family efflux transporter [Acetobacterium sp. K1/6]